MIMLGNTFFSEIMNQSHWKITAIALKLQIKYEVIRLMILGLYLNGSLHLNMLFNLIGSMLSRNIEISMNLPYPMFCLVSIWFALMI